MRIRLIPKSRFLNPFRVSLIPLFAFAMFSYKELAYGEYWHEEMIAYADEDSASKIPDIGGMCLEESFFSARPSLRNGWGLIVAGDYLYWKAEEEGLEYGLQTENNSAHNFLAQSNPFKGVSGNPESVQSHYRSGYRLAMDWNIPHDQWDVQLTWTKFTTSGADSISTKADQIVFPYWMDGNFNPVSTSARAKWGVEFNTLDLDLARSFCFGSHFAVRPFGGFQAAWIEQELTVHYYGVRYERRVDVDTVRCRMRNNYQGYGIRAGLESKYRLGAGFSLLGTLWGSILYGDFHISQFEKTISYYPRGKLKKDLQTLTPQVQMFGGLAWERQFRSERVYLNLHIGWEQQVWFNQNQLYRYVDSWNRNVFHVDGNLTFQGLTAGAKLGF